LYAFQTVAFCPVPTEDFLVFRHRPVRPLLMVKRTKTPTSGYFSPEVIPGAERASEEREIWHQRRRKIEIISRRQ